MQHISLESLAGQDLQGKVWVMDTDTIPGFSCLYADTPARKRIFDIKKRDTQKNLIILAASIEQVRDIVELSEEVTNRLLVKVWPGSVTVAFNEEVAIRIPDDKELLNFLEQVGPCFSTSINTSGEESLVEQNTIEHAFADQIDYIVSFAKKSATQSSTLIKLLR